MTRTDDPAIAVERAMTEDHRAAALGGVDGWDGAHVADLLDAAHEHDHGLQHTEAAWQTWGYEAANLVRQAHPHLSVSMANRLIGMAMMAFVLSGETPLAEDRVRTLAAAAAEHAADYEPAF